MANANTMTKISTVTVGSGGAATIEFTSIPATYTDIVIKYSGRSTAAGNYQNVNIKINTDTGSNYTSKLLYGDGSAAGSDTTTTTFLKFMYIPFSSATASVFGSGELYFAKYAGSIYKSMIADTVTENNATGSGSSIIGLAAGLWSDNSAINAITLTPNSGSWAEHSTASLYGINATTATTALATGGTITYNSGYVYHTFLSSGTFAPTQALIADVLMIAGGGGGASQRGGGGGAGGLVYYGASPLTVSNYTIGIGAGGAGSTSAGVRSSSGADTTFTGKTAATGGGGAGSLTSTSLEFDGRNGGSGGGAALDISGSPYVTGKPGNGTQGIRGGVAYTAGEGYPGGGGGGYSVAGAVGTANQGGAGGNGTSAYSSWGYATATGQLVSGTYYYAGGGGGGAYHAANSNAGVSSVGGYGGGGAGGGNTAAQLGTAGTANTGGGAGGSDNSASTGAAGGSGIIIIRYQVQ